MGGRTGGPKARVCEAGDYCDDMQDTLARLGRWERWTRELWIGFMDGTPPKTADDLRRVLAQRFGEGVTAIEAGKQIKRMGRELRAWNVWARGHLGRDDDAIKGAELREAFGNQYAQALHDVAEFRAQRDPDLAGLENLENALFECGESIAHVMHAFARMRPKPDGVDE